MMKKKNKSNDVGMVSSMTPTQWEMFVKAVAAHVDPVLASMLFATEFQEFDQAKKIVRVATLKKFILFQDLFIEQKKIYQEYLDRVFGFQAMLVVEFNKTAALPKMVQQVPLIDRSISQPQVSVKNYTAEKQRSLDVSDIKKWKITHALLEHFGGSVKEIVKDTHEFDA